MATEAKGSTKRKKQFQNKKHPLPPKTKPNKIKKKTFKNIQKPKTRATSRSSKGHYFLAASHFDLCLFSRGSAAPLARLAWAAAVVVPKVRLLQWAKDENEMMLGWEGSRLGVFARSFCSLVFGLVSIARILGWFLDFFFQGFWLVSRVSAFLVCFQGFQRFFRCVGLEAWRTLEDVFCLWVLRILDVGSRFTVVLLGGCLPSYMAVIL